MGNPGDRVRFWTIQTGLTPQQGAILTLHETQEGIPYAEIIPDAQPERHVYLCERAVWGYELVEQ